MTITLKPEIEEIVNERVRSGAYRSAEEVILTGLRLLQAQEEKLAELKPALQAGLDDIRNGRFTTATTDDELDSLAAEIISQTQETTPQVKQP
ncbi:MAG TPA: type II toxin-antitoxin system ParD family antitoxin [Blastocatellia bacterium]|nr:type II toxin-antitoxin system ParD family antitoxin [Blastocatellia bacterium]